MIATQLSLDDHRLLKRVFGARFAADGTVALPLPWRLKVHTFIEVVGLPGTSALFAWMPGVTSGKGVFTLARFAIMMAALHLAALAMLITRRMLVFQEGSSTAWLHQRGKAFPLMLFLSQKSSIWSTRGTCLKLDGGEFPLKRNVFVSKSTVRMAMSRLEEWIRTQSGGAPSTDNGSIANRDTATFLAFFDVFHCGRREVAFRSRYNPHGAGKLWVATSMVLALSSCVAAIYGGDDFLFARQLVATDVVGIYSFLLSVLWAVYFRTLQREITVRTGECIQVKWRNRIAAYPLWTCWFYAQPGDTQDPSSGPYRPHILLNFGDEVAILAVTGRYTREELDIFAERMNHFLWGSPNPPHDPEAPDDIPPYNLAAARNFIWVPPVVRPRTGAGR